MPFIIRKAKIGDLLKTYEWANEKDVIRNSINRKKKVSFEEHTLWFNNYINSKSNNLFIGTLNNQKIGLVRIDLIKENYFLSYLIDKKKRNKGFGFKMLNKIIKKYKGTKKTIKALVKRNNIASNLIFKKLGFKKKYINYKKNLTIYELENL